MLADEAVCVTFKLSGAPCGSQKGCTQAPGAVGTHLACHRYVLQPGDCRCRVGKSSSALRKTGAKASRRARRPVNSYAKKYTIFATASTARDRPSKRLRLDCPKQGALACNSLRPRPPKARARLQRATLRRGASRTVKSHANAHELSRRRSSVKATLRHRPRH